MAHVGASQTASKTSAQMSWMLSHPRSDGYGERAGPRASLDTLLEMKAEGSIRHIGAGVRSQEFHKELIETGHIDIIWTFLDYTLLSNRHPRRPCPWRREHDVGIILASPLGMGSLTGAEPDVAEERRRNPDAEPKAYLMWKWCQERDVNIRHLAMQFCLAAPVDGIVMFGPADKAQVEDGYEAATADIPEDIWEAFEAEIRYQARGCR